MQLVTHSALLRALGWSLFNSLWQMALLWLLYGVFIRVFKGLSAHVRHGLAVLLLGSGAAWSGLSFLNALYDSDAAGTGLSAILSNGGIAGYSAWYTIREWFNWVLPYCSSIYLLFLTFLFARYFTHYIHSRRLRSSGLHKAQGELRVFVSDTARRMGIGKEVRVWLSSLVDGPLTLGFLKPVILLPFTTVNNLSMAQVEAILLHELAHIRRNDYLLNLGVTFLEIFFFFNPFVRMLVRYVKREREHRCDDLVMQFRYEPHTYVTALLSLARNDNNKNQQLALAAAGENDQLLLRRVRRILDQPQKADRLRIRTILLLFLPMVIACLVFFRSPDRPAISLPGFEATHGNQAASGSQSSQSSEIESRSPRQNSSSYMGVFFTSREQGSIGERMVAGQQFTTGEQVAPAVWSENQFVLVRFITKVNAKMVIAAPPALHCKKIKRTTIHPSEQMMRPAGEDMELAVDDDGSEEMAPSNELIINTAQAPKREYSISNDQVVVIKPLIVPVNKLTPYIPNSSFSYQDRADTILPRARVAAARESATRNLEKAILLMQKDLELQLQNLRSNAVQTELSSAQKEARLAQQSILIEQIKLQKEYLTRQLELEKKLEKIRKKHVIIYI